MMRTETRGPEGYVNRGCNEDFFRCCGRACRTNSKTCKRCDATTSSTIYGLGQREGRVCKLNSMIYLGVLARSLALLLLIAVRIDTSACPGLAPTIKMLLHDRYNICTVTLLTRASQTKSKSNEL